MPKIKREPVPKHIVIPDTNILWDEDKKNSVSPDFDAFWLRNSPLIPLQLGVPEVVIGELHFQQTTSANKIASAISEQILKLNGISQSNYAVKLEQQEIRKQVGNKLDKWLKSLGGEILKTPTGSIDWDKLIQDAIWRNYPFTFDAKVKDNEKGFRDALILETLIGVCNENKGKPQNIVFLCADFLLKTAAEDRLKHNKNLLVFESLTDFESYIKLTQQELTNKFVKSIQARAHKKFYTSDDQTTIFSRDKIKLKITEKFAEEFGESIEIAQAGIATNSSKWIVMFVKWWISTTRFDELKNLREYHWISSVKVARLLGSDRPNDVAGPREMVQVIEYDVKWKANVKADGRFHNLTVTDILKSSTTIEPSSEELITRWKLAPIRNE